MEQLKEENPHITDEDLEIKLSEAVKNKKAANPGPRGPRMPPGGDPAMFAFLPQRVNPPVIPPIQHLIPPAQPVPPPAQPDAMAAQLQAFREVREGFRRNALHMNALQALQTNLAQPGRHDRTRHPAAQQPQQVVAQQAAPIPPYPVRRRTLPVNVVQEVARRQAAGLPVSPVQAMGRQQRAAPQANPFPAAAAQQQAAVQVPIAQPVQPVPLPNRLRRNATIPAAVTPPPANPIVPWHTANPSIPGTNFPDFRNANARLQELHQRWHGAYGNYPYMMYPGQAAATGGDGQAAAMPGGIPAVGPDAAPNPPAAGGAPPMGYLRRRRG